MNFCTDQWKINLYQEMQNPINKTGKHKSSCCALYREPAQKLRQAKKKCGCKVSCLVKILHKARYNAFLLATRSCKYIKLIEF